MRNFFIKCSKKCYLICWWHCRTLGYNLAEKTWTYQKNNYDNRQSLFLYWLTVFFVSVIKRIFSADQNNRVTFCLSDWRQLIITSIITPQTSLTYFLLGLQVEHNVMLEYKTVVCNFLRKMDTTKKLTKKITAGPVLLCDCELGISVKGRVEDKNSGN